MTPVQVNLDIHELIIREVNDDKFTMTVDLDFSALWQEPRLIALGNQSKLFQVGRKLIKVTKVRGGHSWSIFSTASTAVI